MYTMKVEAVAITKAGASNALNGENFNLNGRVLSSADADRGYKGAGSLNGAFVLALASGKAETRSATTAMKVLTSHIEEIKLSRGDYEGAINRYFDNARRDVSLLANDYAEISASLLYAYENNVVIAGLGMGKCFRVADGTVETISSPEMMDETGLAAPYYYHIDNINSKNVFLLCSAGLYDHVDEERIAALMDESISVKQAAQKLLNAAVENGSQQDVTLILASVLPTAPAISPIPYTDDMMEREAPSYESDPTVILPKAVPYSEYDYTRPVDEEEYEEVTVSKAGKVLRILVPVVLGICLILSGIYYWRSTRKSPSPVDSTLITDITTTEPFTEETTTAPETTTEATTGETTTEEDNTDATEPRTNAPTRPTAPSTRPTSPPTTAAPPPTTAPPETDPPQTEPPETEPPETEPPVAVG